MVFRILSKQWRNSMDISICDKLKDFGVACLSDCQKGAGVLDVRIRPMQSGITVSGVAVTVECTAADNLMIHAALEFLEKGDILVVSTPESSIRGFFGELMAMAASKRGAVGLVIDGGVRDIKLLRQMKFPVWARYSYPVSTTKETPGSINSEIICGGAAVSQGDYIVADDDGVVVVKRKDVTKVIEMAEKKIEKEKEVRKLITEGALGLDIYGLREKLQKFST